MVSALLPKADIEWTTGLPPREILNRSFELDQGRHGREEYDYLFFFLTDGDNR